MKRYVALLMAAIMACVLCFGMAGCGQAKQDVEKQIGDSISAELDRVKNLDPDALAVITQSMDDQADLSQFGVTNEQFCKAFLEGFDYKVNSVTVNDDKATVSVDITMKDFSAAVANWMNDLRSVATDQEFLASCAGKSAEEIEQALYTKAGTLLLDALSDVGTKTTTVEFPCVKNGDTWGPASNFDQAWAEAFLDDLSSLNL